MLTSAVPLSACASLRPSFGPVRPALRISRCVIGAMPPVSGTEVAAVAAAVAAVAVVAAGWQPALAPQISVRPGTMRCGVAASKFSDSFEPCMVGTGRGARRYGGQPVGCQAQGPTSGAPDPLTVGCAG